MTRQDTILRAILLAVAALAIVGSALVVRFAPRLQRPEAIAAVPQRVVPAAVLPPVEPVLYRNIAPGDAVAFNATIPFVDGPVPAAAPYRFAGSGEDAARATDCLAAAVFYEAGDDAVGEQAVAQVILNRLRHPAFPKTVCGVVFQGSERSTGCQFTFTCDGALARTPSESAWRRAREIASAALGGFVYKPVGLATHYHTNWVVPYWSASLDKIAEVHTHLFFRWTGWWGTPPAFNRRPLGIEAPVAKLARLSDIHRLGSAYVEAEGALAAAVPFFGRTLQPLPGDADTFLTSLNPAQAAGFASLAQSACGERAKCRFMGWTDPALMGFRLPLDAEQMAAMSFSYMRDRASGLERTLWNCGEFKGKGACMKRAAVRVALPPIDEDVLGTTGTVTAKGPEELSGVRRKPAAEPTPAAKATPAGTE